MPCYVYPVQLSWALNSRMHMILHDPYKILGGYAGIEIGGGIL